MSAKLDSVEFAVHQLEQSLKTILVFGGAGTVHNLKELAERISLEWDEEYYAAAQAVETVMHAIDCDDNGKPWQKGA